MAIKYNQGGTTSTVNTGNNATQLKEHAIKKSLIELAKERYFGQLADTTSMPKNSGKKIKQYLYVPLLDDRNINDQGLDAAGAYYANGNIYGSSKDVGTIQGKLPALSEEGGRVNRVGFSRREIEGSIVNYGFFTEYTRDSINFDSDADLLNHLMREVTRGANEIVEDLLQMDLLNAAGEIRYTGSATSRATVTAVVTYNDIMQLGITLDNNRTPKQTKIITGSRYIDTRTIPAARVMFIGSELIPVLKAMKDLHNQPAFIPVEKYGAATTILNGEIGSVDSFRIVVVPEMMHWEGAGATAPAGPGVTNGKKNVYPMLVVGDESFSCISFLTDGKSVNFETIHKRPQENTSSADPYGKTGFISIQWWYGFLKQRGERIGLIQTAMA